MSKTRLLHHIVFATKSRRTTLNDKCKRELYAYIMGVIENKKCHLLRMNGMPDHIHMLVDVNASVAVADLVRDIKRSSSQWLMDNPDFPYFEGWGEGYYAVSVGPDGEQGCKEYIKNQEAHHARGNFLDELERMAHAYRIPWYPKDWD